MRFSEVMQGMSVNDIPSCDIDMGKYCNQPEGVVVFKFHKPSIQDLHRVPEITKFLESQFRVKGMPEEMKWPEVMCQHISLLMVSFDKTSFDEEDRPNWKFFFAQFFGKLEFEAYGEILQQYRACFPNVMPEEEAIEEGKNDLEPEKE